MKSLVFAAAASFAFAIATVGIPSEHAGMFATPQAHAKFGDRIKRAARKVGRGVKKAARKVGRGVRKARTKIKKFGRTKAGRVLKGVGFAASLVVPGGKVVRGIRAGVKIGKAIRAGRKVAIGGRRARQVFKGARAGVKSGFRIRERLRARRNR